MTAPAEQTHAEAPQSGRRYTRKQQLVAGGVVLALGVGIGVLGTKLAGYFRGHRPEIVAARLDPAAVARELGDKCLKLDVQPSVLIGSSEEKKFGKGSSCTVYWTRGQFSGVSITDRQNPQTSVNTYAVFEPQNVTPTNWVWEVDGRTPSENHVIFQAQGFGASFAIYGYGCAPGVCGDAPPVMSATYPGSDEINNGLLATISSVGNYMLDHPHNPE